MSNLFKNNGGAILKLSEITSISTAATGLKNHNYIIAAVETRNTDTINVTGGTIIKRNKYSDTSTSQANYRYHLIVVQPISDTVKINGYSGVYVVI